MAKVKWCRRLLRPVVSDFLWAPLFLAFAEMGFAQEWVAQDSGTQGALAAVHFADTEVGYAAGFLSVLKTLDGGATWESLVPPANATFVSVFAKSSTEVFVGRQSLYRSRDGGKTWVEISQFPGAPAGSIFDVKFATDSVGYLIKLGKVFRTLDGGTTWGLVLPYEGLYLSKIATPDAQTIYATGGMTYDNVRHADFVRSYDGGDTWQIVSPPEQSEITATTWVGPRAGCVFTFSQQLYWTWDGGDSWTLVNAALGEHVLDASFVDADTGFAVCYSGNILSTIDGGKNWATTRVSASPLSGLARPCGGVCYAVGNTGKIYKRTPEPGTEELKITALDYNAAGGSVTLHVRSNPCRRYRIEVCGDLKTWTNLAERIPNTTAWQLNMSTAGNKTSFYRVAGQQQRAMGQ